MRPSKLLFVTFALLISFASINAVLFTPALPEMSHFFHISGQQAQLTLTWFLVGYTLGQLVYGPMANRFGRKPTLYAGISLQILSSLVCILAGATHLYWLLVIGRFLLALGAGVGLKMTFTLVNEMFEPKAASQIIAYLILSFAITPALSTALGGFLALHFGWVSCFYASAIYGIILLLLTKQLQETHIELDHHALKIKHLLTSYSKQFKNINLISCALLMGGASCFVYVFAAAAPFIAINLYGMNSAEYGIANIIPALGLIIGSLFSVQFFKKHTHASAILLGITITSLSTILMASTAFKTGYISVFISLFFPMALSYFGLALIFPAASTLAMMHISDKAHASAVMNFINMGFTTCIVLCISVMATTKSLLPIVFMVINLMMIALYKKITSVRNADAS